MKPPRRQPASVAGAILLLLSLLLAIRAHMDLDATGRRETLAARELPLPSAGVATAVLYRASRSGPHVPGWATGLLPGLFFLALLTLSDRRAGRSLATPLLVLAGAAALRPSWAAGDAFPEALFPLATIPFLPRRGPGSRLAPLLLVLLAWAVGEAPHLAAVVLGAEALAVPGRRRALAPAVALAVTMHLLLHGLSLPAGDPGWRPPRDPAAWLMVLLALALSARGPRAERARRGALAVHTALLAGSLPLLILETLPRLARVVTRRLARSLEDTRQREALLTVAVVLLLAPFGSRLGPRNATRGLLLPRRPDLMPWRSGSGTVPPGQEGEAHGS